MSDRETLLERLLAGVECGPDPGCWLRPGSGRIKVGGRNRHAHRVAFEVFVRPLEPGEHVCHTCANHACIRPSHLVASMHRTVKLTRLVVKELRRLRQDGWSLARLAKRFAVSVSTASR